MSSSKEFAEATIDALNLTTGGKFHLHRDRVRLDFLDVVHVRHSVIVREKDERVEGIFALVESRTYNYKQFH